MLYIKTPSFLIHTRWYVKLNVSKDLHCKSILEYAIKERTMGTALYNKNAPCINSIC